MKQFMGGGIKNILLKQGIYCSRVAPHSKLKSFFPMVYPIPIGNNFVRLGAENDGGYIIPDDLVGIKACFSPGVGSNSKFEEDLALLGIPSFMADGSINQLPVQNIEFDFTKKNLSDRSTETEIRLSDWISNIFGDETGDFILQMDIEGGEYAVIYDTPTEVLKKFRILAIEFHELDLLASKGGFELIRFAFSKLLKIFSVVHIHPNNYRKPISIGEFLIPPYMEFTFLRNDRIRHINIKKKVDKDFQLSFPHYLDSPNTPKKLNYTLPECWYSPKN